MVNVNKLLELLGDKFRLENGRIRMKYNDGDSVSDSIIWMKNDLQGVNNKIQLIGRVNDTIPLSYYDEIYKRLDNSIFEVDKEKVKSNLEKLGLLGRINENDDYHIFNIGYIRKNNLSYVEKMELIPKNNIYYDEEEIYNNILKASKRWGE